MPDKFPSPAVDARGAGVVTLDAIARILGRRQLQGWLVGGTVRDRELGCSSPDLDIVVAGDAAGVAAEIAAKLRVPWFVLSERHPAYRVMARDGRVDVSPVRGGGILDDLAARDFTVNAMAVPVGGTGLIDPFGGLTHLRERRLAVVSDRVFRDDPLRMMRAARFHHVLGLAIDEPLAATIREQAPLLAAVAAERVVAEMALTLAEGRAAAAARVWERLRLLRQFLPELAVDDRPAAAIAALEQLDNLLVRLPVWFPGAGPVVPERLAQPVDGAFSRPVALRVAALMHPLSPDETMRAARRLKLSDGMVSLLSAAARPHDRAAAARARPRGREAVLFLWGAMPWELEVILVEAAKAALAKAPTEQGSGDALAGLRNLLELWQERHLHGAPRPPVDGNSLMSELGLESGPLLGLVLREARLAWEAGEAADRDGVLAVARAALARATGQAGS